MNKDSIKNVVSNKLYWVLAAVVVLCIAAITIIWVANNNEPEVEEVVIFETVEEALPNEIKQAAILDISEFVETHKEYLDDEQLAELDKIQWHIENATNVGDLEKWNNEYLLISEPVRQRKIEDEEAARLAAEQAQQQVSYSYSGSYSTPASTGSNFMFDGVWTDEDFKYTWYSSNQMYHYRTGEWTPDENGVYRDKDGYAVVAAQLRDPSQPQSENNPGYLMGEIIEDTAFGTAKVYDTGWMQYDPSTGRDHLDVYVNF